MIQIKRRHVIFLILLALAGIYDLVIISTYGLSSGLTVSWQLYSAARDYPAVAFFAGYAVHYLTEGHEVPFLFAFVQGHIFGTMRGA